MQRGLRRLAKWLNGMKVPSVPRLSRVKMTFLWVSVVVVFVLLLFVLGLNHSFPLLQTRGEIANRQRDLLVLATVLALFVLVPVYALLFAFAWRYRAGHTKQYRPNWGTHKGYEALWWGIPIAIIGVLAVVTWVTSHSLDPFKPLASSQPALKVQVVAMQWKWLFLYPDQQVASVNEVALPVGRPVEFILTSDAPMNSFWIPQLGGQIYAMTGMSTKLHLMADTPGDYRGVSSNISGKGFADMRFTAKALEKADFEKWLLRASQSSKRLDQSSYDRLAKPAASQVTWYRLDQPELYDRIVMKYMSHDQNAEKPTEEKQPSQAKPLTEDHSTHMHMEGM